MQAVKASLIYFALVFAVGFVLGTIRTLWVVPRFGTRAAELMEMPIMLAVTIVAARWLILRLAVPSTPSARLEMGCIALALLLIAEFGLVRWLRGLSIREYLATRDPVSGTVYYLMLAVFAVMPLFVVKLVVRAFLKAPLSRVRANRLRGGLSPAALRRVQLFVEANLGRPIRLSDLAERAALSAYHFARAFKTSTATTPRAFIERRRIEKARRLLRDSDLSLAEIAIDAGFETQSRLTTVFGRATGLTPAVYRKGAR